MLFRSETTSEFDKEKLQERLAKMAGGVAVIRVGAATETEIHFIIVSSPAQNKTINSTVMSAVNANDKKIPFFIFSVFSFRMP